ncbi:hypothetical protein CoNPh8_CDS0139 [Staphylococcus phage S-CoN_Ph8]|nr:hypothetical protein CoNPh8_CDS0139 [Staphylococcus phage S-CoN_Ph8]
MSNSFYELTETLGSIIFYVFYQNKKHSFNFYALQYFSLLKE